MTERFDQEPDQETPIPVPTDEDDIRQYLREIRSKTTKECGHPKSWL